MQPPFIAVSRGAEALHRPGDFGWRSGRNAAASLEEKVGGGHVEAAKECARSIAFQVALTLRVSWRRAPKQQGVPRAIQRGMQRIAIVTRMLVST